MIRADDPVVTVPEIADEMDRSDTHVRNQLLLLEREGAVESKEVGARAVAWWHSERVSPPRLPPEDHPDQSGLSDVDPTDAAQSAERDGRDSDPAQDSIAAAVDDVASDWDDDDRLEERRAAAIAALRFIRREGAATAKELREHVEPEHPVDGQNPRTWYRKTIRPVLNEAATYSQATQEWTVSVDE